MSSKSSKKKSREDKSRSKKPHRKMGKIIPFLEEVDFDEMEKESCVICYYCGKYQVGLCYTCSRCDTCTAKYHGTTDPCPDFCPDACSDDWYDF
jgi:hypothetical protein